MYIDKRNRNWFWKSIKAVGDFVYDLANIQAKCLAGVCCPCMILDFFYEFD